MNDSQPFLALFGGPAGAGKSAIARAWCESRPRAAHVEFDALSNHIVGGAVDLQTESAEASRQVAIVAKACCRVALAYLDSGIDVALDHVFWPGEIERDWLPHLGACEWRLVIVRPTLEETLRRAKSRSKQIRESLIEQQHRAALEWPDAQCIDTTGLSVEQSLRLAEKVLRS